MLRKEKFKPAKKENAKKIALLFSTINGKFSEKKAKRLIENRKIVVLKRKKKIVAAVSYTVISFLGIFAIMYISKIAVLPELRGEGLGSLILSRMRIFNLRAGMIAFFLFSVKKAKRFYEKNNLKGLGRLFWWKSV